MSDFFLSYSRHDQQWVRRLADTLEDQTEEDSVHIDVDGILPSEAWRQRLEQLILESKLFVFILSDASIHSEECAKELAVARKYGKRILPLNHKLSAPEDVDPGLASLHWIDAPPSRTMSSVAKELHRALHTDIERLRAHTRLSVRAAEWKAGAWDSLLVGSDLAAAEALIESGKSDPTATDEQRVFVKASRAALRRRRLAAAFFTAAALLVIVVVGLVARNRWQASRFNAMLGEAEKLLESDPMTARRLVLDAVEDCPSTERARLDEFVARLLITRRPTALIGPVGGQSVLWSEDGKHLATGPGRSALTSHPNDTLEIWRVDNGENIASMKGWSLATSALVKTEESFIAVDTAGRLVLLNPKDGSVFGETMLYPARQKAIVQGRIIDVSNADRRPIKLVRVWDSSGLPKEFDLHAGLNGLQVLDPRMEFLARANGGTVQLDFNRGEIKTLEVPPEGGLGAISSIAMSPDGDFVVAATEAGIDVWTREGKRIERFHDPEAKMQTWTAAFDPTGTSVITTQGTSTHVSVWDLSYLSSVSPRDDVPASAKPPTLRLRGANTLWDARFGPDASVVATLQQDSHIVIWETGLPAARFDFTPTETMATLTSPRGWRLSKTDSQKFKVESLIDTQVSINMERSGEVSDATGRIVLRGQPDGGIATLELVTDNGDVQIRQLTENLRFVDLLGFSNGGGFFAIGSIRGVNRRIMVYRCSASGLDPEARLDRLRSEHARCNG